MTSTTDTRRQLKLQFLQALPSAQLNYLIGKRGIAVGYWHREPIAREIFKAAQDSRVYGGSTAAVDVLSALRNQVERENLLPSELPADPARRGWLLLTTCCPGVPEDQHPAAMEQLLADLGAYAETLKDPTWRQRPLTATLIATPRLQTA